FAVPIDLAEAGGHRFGIAPDDWLTYLREKFAEKKIAIDDSSVDRLLDVTADLLAIAYEQALRELERPFALHWSELGQQKYLQLVATRVAQGAVLFGSDTTPPVPRPEVLRALESLRARGLVTRLGRGRYEFIEPMFGEYVRRVAGSEPGIVPKR